MWNSVWLLSVAAIDSVGRHCAHLRHAAPRPRAPPPALESIKHAVSSNLAACDKIVHLAGLKSVISASLYAFSTPHFPLHKLHVQYCVDSKDAFPPVFADALVCWNVSSASIIGRQYRDSTSWSMTSLLPSTSSSSFSPSPPPHTERASVRWHSGERLWVCCLHKSLISSHLRFSGDDRLVSSGSSYLEILSS